MKGILRARGIGGELAGNRVVLVQNRGTPSPLSAPPHAYSCLCLIRQRGRTDADAGTCAVGHLRLRARLSSFCHLFIVWAECGHSVHSVVAVDVPGQHGEGMQGDEMGYDGREGRWTTRRGDGASCERRRDAMGRRIEVKVG